MGLLRVLEEHGIAFFVRPQSAHDRTNVELKREVFSYDAGQDAYICPAGKQLRLNTKTRVKLWPHFWAANVPSHQICRFFRASL